MGVRRLQTFLEQHCPEACYSVNIQDLATEYRNSCGQDPVIVVDGLSCVRKLYATLDWVCGGQCKEFADVVEYFITKFKELKIDLVFFFDGSTQTRKRSAWVNRRYSQMKDAFMVLGELKKGKTPKALDDKYFMLPCGVSGVVSSFAKKLCTAFRSVKECDEEIAEYAVRNKCFAILGQDSDFVIYKQDAMYLSVEKLNLDTMTTCCYDRKALSRCLGLLEYELPVLATLMGNDVIEANQLKRFHHKITGIVSNQPYTYVLVHKLAAFIHNLPKQEALLRYLPELSRVMFGTRRHAVDLKESILCYDVSPAVADVAHLPDSSWEKILRIAQKDYVEMSASSHLYAILRGLPFEMSTALEDYKEIPASSEVLKPLRQRIYGVALRDNPEIVKGSAIVVEEWCMSGPRSLEWSAKVRAVLPSESFPSLLDLWVVESDLMKSAKFDVLGWIMSPALSSTDLARLPFEIMAPACILSFLYNDVRILLEWEVRVFAAVAVEVQSMSSCELSGVNISQVDIRGVHLAVLFTRALTHLGVANSVCGHPIPRQWVKHLALFDGKLFQSKYLLARNGPVPIKENLRVGYELLCSVVFS